MFRKAGDNNKSEVDDFWKETEESLGEKVLARSLGQYLSGYENWTRQYWGIFFITDSTLHFRHFKQENWYAALLASAIKELADDEREFSIPRSSIVNIVRSNPPAGFMRFLLRTDPEAVIVIRTADGQERKLHLRIEQNPNAFYKELTRG